MASSSVEAYRSLNLRPCLVGLLEWLSWLISHKPNQTTNHVNALIAKANAKVALRGKHARRCFLALAVQGKPSRVVRWPPPSPPLLESSSSGLSFHRSSTRRTGRRWRLTTQLLFHSPQPTAHNCFQISHSLTKHSLRIEHHVTCSPGVVWVFHQYISMSCPYMSAKRVRLESLYLT
jgi:hypothetical protein